MMIPATIHNNLKGFGSPSRSHGVDCLGQPSKKHYALTISPNRCYTICQIPTSDPFEPFVMGHAREREQLSTGMSPGQSLFDLLAQTFPPFPHELAKQKESG